MSTVMCPAPDLLPAEPDLRLVGDGLTVPLVTGQVRRFTNLDYAASAPCLRAVRAAVDEFLPWYSSVHRGAGFPSQVATAAYEGAREAVRSFVRARPDDTVVFTRNTTEAINVLAAALPPDAEVLAFAVEHHANLLPWRRRSMRLLPVPASPAEALEVLDSALTAAAGAVRLVAVTGASNVTGEIWPYPEIAALAHRHGARVLLDAAQLAPHRPVDVATSGVDYLVLSGHKLYAPFGAGALVGRADWLRTGEPFIAGGGAVRYVTADSVLWADPPDRHEAGSPNVVGAVALGVACRTLQAAGMDTLAAAEEALLGNTALRLAAITGVRLLRTWPVGNPRIGVLPFTLDAMPYAQVAAVLSAEYGIGVRHGCFCAHPLVAHLLGIDADRDRAIQEQLRAGATAPMPGAVRASVGLGTSAGDLDRLVDAVSRIARHGPRWTYRTSPDGTDCRPEPDPRPWPRLSVEFA